MEPKQSGGVIVYHEKDGERQYLLLHYMAGHWDLPKGHIEDGEDAKQAAVRELAEETGIEKIALHKDFKEKIAYEYEWKEKMIPKEVTFFLGVTPTEEVKLSDEHSDYVWLPAEKAMKKATFENAKDLIKSAEKALENPQ